GDRRAARSAHGPAGDGRRDHGRLRTLPPPAGPFCHRPNSVAEWYVCARAWRPCASDASPDHSAILPICHTVEGPARDAPFVEHAGCTKGRPGPSLAHAAGLARSGRGGPGGGRRKPAPTVRTTSLGARIRACHTDVPRNPGRGLAPPCLARS